MSGSPGEVRLRVCLAQINPIVGDLAANAASMTESLRVAKDAGADLVVFPELVLDGYPVEDLALRPSFQRASRAALHAWATHVDTLGLGDVACLVGYLDHSDDVRADQPAGGPLNAAALVHRGQVLGRYVKHHLPNYGVFDEARYFVPGDTPLEFLLNGAKVSVAICEDLWRPGGPVAWARDSGPGLLAVLNASPYERSKDDTRLALCRTRAQEADSALVYVNLVGGQDELVFDGASFVLNADRDRAAQCSAFAEHVALTRWEKGEKGWACVDGPRAPTPDASGAIYAALVLGLRDYVAKNRFPGTILGLSGGIDSALTAAIAADALGPDKVRAVMMPSRYTSRESLEDAAACAKLLGIAYETISIEPAVDAFGAMLAGAFAGTNSGIAEENIQSRARGLTLMALSNKFGHMVVSTGNKSEMSAGYATLYGDMCGGFAVLKDVYKTTVFELSRWRNANRPEGALGPRGPVMPERVIVKPPTAELREGQTDEASLGPYARLDAILRALVEGEKTVAEVVAAGYAEDEVRRVWRMLDLAEYKRRQAPPGVKITRRAFGRERRYPIVNGFRG